jgi:hypothetical protein
MERSLEQRDKRLAEFYLGALRVLADRENPDRFSLCAHGLRELMEKLPEYLDVPSIAQRESLKPKVRQVEDVWLGVQVHSSCFAAGNWEGTIDAHLRKLLSHLGSFFEWFAQHNPRRKQEMQSALVILEGSGRSLPPVLADLNVSAWEAKRDFFVNVAHHRKMVGDKEFGTWLEALERFLLDRLIPRTFDEYAKVDALVDEEEHRD